MTPYLFAASMLHIAFGIVLCVTAVFLMLIILVQRGRGGGLAGAFGGAGGQSAFGTKAGDLFTRITIGVATFWIILCLTALWALGTPSSRFGAPTDEPTMSAPDGSGGDEQPAPDGASPDGAEPAEDAGDSGGND
jgi:preprotein translocase subunit SecG